MKLSGYLLPVWSLASLCSSAATGALVARADSFRVTKPAVGDSLVLRPGLSNPLTFNVEWTVAKSLENRPVQITLLSGTDLKTAQRFTSLTSSAVNNGSFFVSSYTYSSWQSGYSSSHPSRCNYTFELKIWTYVAYSDYFTIIDPDDTGLPTSAKCPTDNGQRNIANNSASVDTSSIVSSSDSSSGGSSGNSNSGSSGSSGGSSATQSNGSGFGTGALIAAIVVPIVVLLIVFGLIMFFGIRRNWFLNAEQKRLLLAPNRFQSSLDREPSEYNRARFGNVAMKEQSSGTSELHDQDFRAELRNVHDRQRAELS